MQKIKARLFAGSKQRYANHRWYGAYRDLQLKDAISHPFAAGALPKGYGRWVDERIVEYPWLLSNIPAGPGSLLDAGSTLNHGFVLAHERLRNKTITIMTLAPEKNCFWRRGISYVFGDLRHSNFRDESFDNVISLSVIEHIGMDNSLYAPPGSHRENNPEAYVDAIYEFRRLLRPGGECYISVPYGKHRIRGWLQIFDGAMLDRAMSAFRPESHEIEFFMYSETSGWQRSSRDEAAEAVYFDVHSEKPWPGCPAAAGAVACLKLRK